MSFARIASVVTASLVVSCAGNPDRRTIGKLRHVEPDTAEVQVEDGLDQAMLAYRKFLEEAPVSALTPEAMRRLADLKLEKEYGILGDGGPVALAAPEAKAIDSGTTARSSTGPAPASIGDLPESVEEFERRAAREADVAAPDVNPALEMPGGEEVAWSGPLEALELYDQILETYPTYEHNDQVLYQKARAFDELGRTDEAIAVTERLVTEYPGSRYIDEVQFRRAEYFFTRRKFLGAEEAYGAVTRMGPNSEYYELALYKLGWTFYKQQLHEESLAQYIALLDYKVSSGYDFEQSEDVADQRRVSDTYRVISLSFSELGGPVAVEDYFRTNGSRSYEDRIYSELGEFYLEKLRYHDAAGVYQTFVGLHPLHRSSPHFSMRVVEVYEAGGFPKLVLEAKKDFAASYGLSSEYWRHFDVSEELEVRSYLKNNLNDLANHYHALYQDPGKPDEKSAHFQEAALWYEAYLASFAADPETPAIHYQLADLLLEHRDFGRAAREYERIAYEYPTHEQAAGAGYAAIYAYREHQKATEGEAHAQVKREAVASTLRFVDRFPDQEHAATVLGAAVDDLYDMQEFEQAIGTGHRLIDAYPLATLPLRRSAWTVVAHASFDLAKYVEAEDAYTQVVEMTPAEDETRQDVVDNLAAAIYKQGEQAALVDDHRLAADHFLRITNVASTSDIRPVAEYDAGAALIRLQDWAGAAAVLEAFREAYPEHELHSDATKQMAFVYREQGNLTRAAEEYERVARDTEDPELRRDAMLLAAKLYEDSGGAERALAVYLDYVAQFPRPLELAVETRFKIAEMYRARNDEAAYHGQLREIVEIDRAAGGERTERSRTLAARSALVLSEVLYGRFDEVELVQPFEQNLQEKQLRMDAALDAFSRLVDYEVGEVTAAATFYMAEVYFDFSRALMESERPVDISSAELQDYELVLEEEAFPFEERAIEVHEKNLELLSAGVFNRWIEQSLEKLAVLMPGRYAKFEASSGLIASIDTWVYRRPNAREAGTGAEPVAPATEPAAPGAETRSEGEREPARENEVEPVESAEPAVAAG